MEQVYTADLYFTSRRFISFSFLLQLTVPSGTLEKLLLKVKGAHGNTIQCSVCGGGGLQQFIGNHLKVCVGGGFVWSLSHAGMNATHVSCVGRNRWTIAL